MRTTKASISGVPYVVVKQRKHYRLQMILRALIILSAIICSWAILGWIFMLAMILAGLKGLVVSHAIHSKLLLFTLVFVAVLNFCWWLDKRIDRLHEFIPYGPTPMD